MLVRELMTSPAVTTDEAQSATTVIRLLDRYRVTSLPVVDQEGRLVGIIGEADVIADAAVLGEPVTSGWGIPPRASVRDRMVRRVVGVDADTDVVDAVALMCRATLKSLPVLLGGRVVGMLSRSDVVRAAAESDRSPESAGMRASRFVQARMAGDRRDMEKDERPAGTRLRGHGPRVDARNVT